jgi:predicted N-acetyltransferase YhbS
MNLPDGLVLRTAREADLDQICTLLAARGDEADAEDLLLVANDPDEGLDSVLVVVDGERVVSTATLLRESVHIGGVAVPTGQVEMVATDPEVEGRGLVRALMDEAHRRSTSRGDLLQVMVGIPYFYRQFGYSYSMPIPLPWTIVRDGFVDAEIRVRPAVHDDIEAMAALHDGAQARADVSMPHSAGCWRWLVERSGTEQLVAMRDGVVVATARRTPPDEGVVLGEVAGSIEGISALVADAVHRASSAGEHDVTVLERPGTAVDAVLADLGSPPAEPDRDRSWFYARVPDLAPVLEHLRPVLLDRFRAAGLTGRHDVLLSSWRRHVRFTIDETEMSPVVAGGPEQAPVSKGGSGIPPDLIAPMLLGPSGAAGLERSHGDALLGRQRAVMESLFPPVTSDVLTFYLAW